MPATKYEVTKSYFTNNVFAESPEPLTVFSSWFTSVLVITWLKGKMFPTVRPHTPVSSLNHRGAIDLLTPNKHPLITLIAGGAGITPIITLVFGVNSDADVLFRKEFEELERQFGKERFRAVYTVNRLEEGSVFRKGYEKSRVFVCSPPAIETALLRGKTFGSKKGGILEELGYRKD
ncbi:hypothetical protein DL95DRAFT_489793 [Leptodontidium sp. 2 PMI_412]|nr:hypothetical protein DL95DRAFT_489793 [Leptodontidium sp. 2 PMI_412]